jgi:hypothetical protein
MKDHLQRAECLNVEDRRFAVDVEHNEEMRLQESHWLDGSRQWPSVRSTGVMRTLNLVWNGLNSSVCTWS